MRNSFEIIEKCIFLVNCYLNSGNNNISNRYPLNPCSNSLGEHICYHWCNCVGGTPSSDNILDRCRV